MKHNKPNKWQYCGDVNWREHGGVWGCRVDSNEWRLVRFECVDTYTQEGEGLPPYIVTTYVIDPADCDDSVRQFIGADPADELPEFRRALAVCAYWGSHFEADRREGANSRKLLRWGKRAA